MGKIFVMDNSKLAQNNFCVFIYTIKCGPGNSAKSFDELGENTEEDKCCRAHVSL